MLTVREIAQACEMNVGLLYHYFEGKDALIRQALDHAIQLLMRGYEERRTTRTDPLAEILAWLEVHIETAPTVIRMVKLMTDYASLGIPDKELDALIADFYRGEKDLLEGALRRGVDMGRFKPLDVARIARRIGLMLDGIFSVSPGRGDNRVIEDVADLADALPEWTGVDEEQAPRLDVSCAPR